jgi:LysR family glycine cleavage system transcriptional activator
LAHADYFVAGIDVGVRYGPGKWPKLIATTLMQEEIFPVCCPSLLPHSCLQINDIPNLPLRHGSTMPHRAEFPSWHMRLAHHNIDVSHAERHLKINNSAAVVQAAIDGQGVALGRDVGCPTTFSVGV